MAKKDKKEGIELPQETSEEIEKRLNKYRLSLLKQANKNEGKLKDRLGPVPKTVSDADKEKYRQLRKEYQDSKSLRAQLLEKMNECLSEMAELKGE